MEYTVCTIIHSKRNVVRAEGQIHPPFRSDRRLGLGGTLKGGFPPRHLLAFIFATATGATFFAQLANAQVVIGVSIPITGPRADLGRNAKQGVELAVAEINQAGGVLGKPLQVAYEDDQGDNPNAARNAVSRLMKVDNAQLMLGPFFSVAQMATQKIYCDGSIISLTGASGVTVTSSGCKYVIRTRANDKMQSKALLTYVRASLKTDKIGVIYLNDDFGKAGSDRVVKALEEVGIKPVALESHNAGDKDFSAQLSRLRDAGAAVAILWTNDIEAALIIRQAKQLDMPYKFAGSAAMSSPTFLNLAGDAADGLISVNDFIPGNPDPKTQRFVKKYEARYKNGAELYAANFYDSIHLAVKAITAAGSSQPAKVRKAFETIRYSGVLGDYSCETDGDCNHQLLIVEVQKGIPVVKSRESF